MIAKTKLPSIGLHYNAEIRNNGTARRVHDTLVRMGAKDSGLVRYNRPSYADVGSHDVHIFIDDGRDEIPMPEFKNKSACWLVDSHLGYEQRLKWAREFDFAFLCQRPDVERMLEDGVENVHWLPLACYPAVDPTMSEMRQADLLPDVTHKDKDVAFVGYLNNGFQGKGNNRIMFLDKVFEKYPNSWLAFNRFFLEAATRYHRAKVGFNISIKNDLNMRFFEVLSYGTCLVTNRDVVGWDSLGFVDGEHFIGYEGMDDAVEKVGWALEHPMEREKIAKEGWKKVRSGHTYEHRIMEMLKVCDV
jgi:spore maturation protein CgeB